MGGVTIGAKQALQIKSTATALGRTMTLSAICFGPGGNEFVTVKSLNEQGQPVGVEIFITATISRSNPTFMRAQCHH